MKQNLSAWSESQKGQNVTFSSSLTSVPGIPQGGTLLSCLVQFEITGRDPGSPICPVLPMTPGGVLGLGSKDFLSYRRVKEERVFSFFFFNVIKKWITFFVVVFLGLATQLSSPTRDWICGPLALEAQSLNHWTTRSLLCLAYSHHIPPPSLLFLGVPEPPIAESCPHLSCLILRNCFLLSHNPNHHYVLQLVWYSNESSIVWGSYWQFSASPSWFWHLRRGTSNPQESVIGKFDFFHT